MKIIKTKMPALLMLTAALLAGCAGTVGSRYRVTPAEASGWNASANKTVLSDDEGTWLAEGLGPARHTTISADGTIATFQQGSVPRDATITMPDGTRINVSSGTDVGASAVRTFDAGGKRLEIIGFSTSASSPMRAFAGIVDASMPGIIATTQAQRDATIAGLKVQGEAAASVLALLEAVWAVYAPVPAAMGKAVGALAPDAPASTLPPLEGNR